MNQLSENPYSAPEADLETPVAAHDLSVFPRFTTWAVFGLSIITLGLYSLYWIYDRSKKLNSITEDKISHGFMTATLVVYLASYVLSFAPLIMGFGSEMLAILEPLLSLASFVMMIVWVFMFRNRLNTITQSEGKPTWCGPILTFFFQVLYLNYKINQHLDLQQANQN